MFHCPSKPASFKNHPYKGILVDRMLCYVNRTWTCFDALLPLLPQKVFFHNHICTFINRYTQSHQAHIQYLTQSAPSIIHSAINTGQHTVLFNHSQTMNLWGKELRVFHLCEVAMATPQQTLDRMRVFPINAFFPL